MTIARAAKLVGTMLFVWTTPASCGACETCVNGECQPILVTCHREISPTWIGGCWCNPEEPRGFECLGFKDKSITYNCEGSCCPGKACTSTGSESQITYQHFICINGQGGYAPCITDGCELEEVMSLRVTSSVIAGCSCQ